MMWDPASFMFIVIAVYESCAVPCGDLNTIQFYDSEINDVLMFLKQN